MCGMLLADLGPDVVRVDRLQASGLGVAIAPRFDVNARLVYGRMTDFGQKARWPQAAGHD
jgi:crotonobetainyl-CoA:carnitine CoA-transferase CaiB-like acyl-CoA transferase